MKKRLNKKGFTLIELVIVVAVLAILAVVAVPAVGGIVDKSKGASDKAQLALLQGAIERYNAEKGKYPNEANDADTKTDVLNNAIKMYTNLDSVSAPQTSGYHFFYNKSNGKVTWTQSGTGLVQLD